MGLADTYNLAQNAGFIQRVLAAIVHAALNVATEIANEVQALQITGNPTGGTFTLTLNGQTTAPLAFNATAGQVQAALQALSGVGSNNVVCAGGPLPNQVAITFAGTLGGCPQNLLSHADSLTGGSAPVAVVSRTTTGVAVPAHSQRQALASRILNNPLGYAQLMAPGVADSATVQADFPGPSYAQSGGVTTAQADADIQNQINAIFAAYT
jgi:hypothetical protein